MGLERTIKAFKEFSEALETNMKTLEGLIGLTHALQRLIEALQGRDVLRHLRALLRPLRASMMPPRM